MKILECFKRLLRSSIDNISTQAVLLSSRSAWSPRAWSALVHKLRHYSYRNNDPLIHYRHLRLDPIIGPTAWYLWVQLQGGVPVGAIEVFIYYRTGVVSARLDFHGDRSIDHLPRYFVRYDRLWIDGFIVPEPIRGSGLGGQILGQLDMLAKFFNVWIIQGTLGKKDADIATRQRLSRFYTRHGYHHKGSLIEKFYDPPRKLDPPKPCTTFPPEEAPP